MIAPMTFHPPGPSPEPPVTHLLYLHGFRSSPRSAKAVKVAQRIAQRHPGVTWWCPQLPPSPREAMAQVMAGIAGWPRAGTYDTLAGFLMAMLRRIPRRTDVVEWEGWRFEVVDVDSYRVDQVMITAAAPAGPVRT